VTFKLSRLRAGELIVGSGAGLALLVMFLLPWYGGAGAGSVNGWHGLSHIRWLLLVTILVAFAVVYFQATRPAPAIPSALAAVLTPLAAVTALALLYRVIINLPGGGDINAKAGGYLGLLGALLMLAGAVGSLRQEGIAPGDGPSEIPTVRASGTG
jgi:hypothetical protein